MSHTLRTRCKACGWTAPLGCPECGPGCDHGTWDTDSCPNCPATLPPAQCPDGVYFSIGPPERCALPEGHEGKCEA